MIRLTAVLLLLGMGAALAAPPPARTTDRYVSQRGDQAYLREGPSFQHKIVWVYRHRGYPFRVIASFDVWRRVETPDGIVGWMSASMLTDRRTVLVTGKGRVEVHAKADGGKLVGLADPGAVAGLKRCTPEACRISGQSIDGWVARDRLWGVGKGEIFK
jgi:SH3-like domain-containing protein